MSVKTLYPNLEEFISWVKDKLKKEGSSYELTKNDLEDTEIAYEFQTRGINQRLYN